MLLDNHPPVLDIKDGPGDLPGHARCVGALDSPSGLLAIRVEIQLENAFHAVEGWLNEDFGDAPNAVDCGSANLAFDGTGSGCMYNDEENILCGPAGMYSLSSPVKSYCFWTFLDSSTKFQTRSRASL